MCDSQKNGENKKEKEEEKEMSTETLTDYYTLNEQEAKKIICSPIKKIKPTNVKHDFMLSEDKRIAQARKILDSHR